MSRLWFIQRNVVDDVDKVVFVSDDTGLGVTWTDKLECALGFGEIEDAKEFIEKFGLDEEFPDCIVKQYQVGVS